MKDGRKRKENKKVMGSSQCLAFFSVYLLGCASFIRSVTDAAKLLLLSLIIGTELGQKFVERPESNGIQTHNLLILGTLSRWLKKPQIRDCAYDATWPHLDRDCKCLHYYCILHKDFV